MKILTYKTKEDLIKLIIKWGVDASIAEVNKALEGAQFTVLCESGRAQFSMNQIKIMADGF